MDKRPWWKWWEEDFGEKFNNELDKRQRGLRIFEQFESGTFGYYLGKFKILEGLEKEFDVKIKYKLPSLKIWLAYLVYKGWLPYPFKLPSFYTPAWYYELDGHKLLMDNKDFRMREVLKDYTYVKVWEPETSKLVKEHVKTGDVCVDIGASIGPFTLLFARQVGPTGKVFAFEPTDMCFNYLNENIDLNGYRDRCYPIRMAAYSNSSDVKKVPMNNPYASWINTVTVDDWLESKGQERVDFIKIDVDGPEPEVLEGLIRTFERNPQLKMVVEFYPKYIKGAGCDPDKFMSILNKYFTYSVIPDDYTEGCWNFYCERK
jgi:FkbM family methyltransferase